MKSATTKYGIPRCRPLPDGGAVLRPPAPKSPDSDKHRVAPIRDSVNSRLAARERKPDLDIKEFCWPHHPARRRLRFAPSEHGVLQYKWNEARQDTSLSGFHSSHDLRLTLGAVTVLRDQACVFLLLAISWRDGSAGLSPQPPARRMQSSSSRLRILQRRLRKHRIRLRRFESNSPRSIESLPRESLPGSGLPIASGARRPVSRGSIDATAPLQRGGRRKQA